MPKITIKDKDWKTIKEINSDTSKTLISQIRESWVEVNSACHMGMCWACMMNIESWVENVVKNKKTEPSFPLWKDEVMTCIAWVNSLDRDISLKQVY